MTADMNPVENEYLICLIVIFNIDQYLRIDTNQL